MRIFKPLNSLSADEQRKHHLELAKNFLILAEKDERSRTGLIKCAENRIADAKKV